MQSHHSNFTVLARKWRPRQFTQMVGQDVVLRMLTQALDTQRLHHAYLFTGTRGVGKTSLGRILAKCLNCEKGITSNPCNTCSACTSIDAGKFLDLMEIDAASRTKVEDTRDLLDNVQYAPTQGRFKIYLIDEVHMLSGHSFNALLKTLEEPPAHVKFILATTDPKKLPITILSRCLQFHLKKVDTQEITKQLHYIADQEGISVEPNALDLVAVAAEGSMRDALSLLDQTIAYCGQHISVADTKKLLGTIEKDSIFKLLNALQTRDGEKLLAVIDLIASDAPDFIRVLDELLSVLHDISVTQIVPEKMPSSETISTFAKQFSAEDIQLYYQIALLGRRDLPLSPHPLHGFEMVMLRMLAFTPVTEPTIVKPLKVTQSTDWSTILPELKLTGLAYTLASHCVLTTLGENTVQLALPNKYESMLNKKLSDRIEEALTAYLKKPVTLTIQITTEDINSPAKISQEKTAAQKNAATKALQNDAQVMQIMDVFDATLDMQTVKPVDS